MKPWFQKYCFSKLFFILTAALPCHAQEAVHLNIIPTDSAGLDVLKHEKLNFTLKDSISAILKLRELENKYFNKDYLEISYDSLQYADNHVTAYLHLGYRYIFDSVRVDGVSPLLLRKAGLFAKDDYLVHLSYSEFVEMRRMIIQQFESTGYPFARVKHSNISINKGIADCNLEIIPGRLVRIDSVIFKGNPRISTKYCRHYLQIKKNSKYNQSAINRFDQLMANMYFIQQTRPAEIEFRGSAADIYLYLVNKPANYFSGMVNFSSEDNGSGDFLITGDISLNLVNSFKIAERIDFSWNRFDDESQNLKVGLNFPYIFILPLGIDCGLALEKFSNQYFNSDINFGLEYRFSGSNGIKAFAHQKNSFIIDNDTMSVNGQNNAFSSNTGGLTLFFNNTDYRPNPGKGFFLEASAGYGKMQNEDQTEQTVLEFNFKVAWFYHVYGSFSIGFNGLAAGMHGPPYFYNNQLFKIGGIQTLRGFDERSIMASIYSILSIEPKIRISKNSAFFLFADLAWYESRRKDDYFSDWPVGTGSGISLDTKAGIFSLIYALGKEKDLPFKFSSSKVHVGFKTRF